jgi:hypothetical protein
MSCCLGPIRSKLDAASPTDPPGPLRPDDITFRWLAEGGNVGCLRISQFESVRPGVFFWSRFYTR